MDRNMSCFEVLSPSPLGPYGSSCILHRPMWGSHTVLPLASSPVLMRPRLCCVGTVALAGAFSAILGLNRLQTNQTYNKSMSNRRSLFVLTALALAFSATGELITKPQTNCYMTRRGHTERSLRFTHPSRFVCAAPLL